MSAIAAALGVVLTLVGLFVARADAPVGERPGDEASSPPVATSTEDVETDQLLFVYGSTKPDQSRYPLIERFVESYERDSVPGFLYDSGQDYPLAQFGPGDAIPGFVLQFHQEDAEEAFREMTAMESGLFERVRVRTSSGRLVNAYEWIGAIDGFPRVEGEWRG